MAYVTAVILYTKKHTWYSYMVINYYNIYIKNLPLYWNPTCSLSTGL